MKHIFTLLLTMMLALPAVAMAAAHAPMPSVSLANECHEKAGHPKPSGSHEGMELALDCLGCAVPPASVRPLASVGTIDPIPYRTALKRLDAQYASSLDPPPPRNQNRNNV